MPKTIIDRADRMAKEFEAHLKTQTLFAGTNMSKVCKITRICSTTLRNREKDPEGLTLGEIKKLNKLIRLDPMLLLRIAGYSRADLEKALRKE